MKNINGLQAIFVGYSMRDLKHGWASPAWDPSPGTWQMERTYIWGQNAKCASITSILWAKSLRHQCYSAQHWLAVRRIACSWKLVCLHLLHLPLAGRDDCTERSLQGIPFDRATSSHADLRLQVTNAKNLGGNRWQITAKQGSDDGESTVKQDFDLLVISDPTVTLKGEMVLPVMNSKLLQPLQDCLIWWMMQCLYAICLRPSNLTSQLNYAYPFLNVKGLCLATLPLHLWMMMASWLAGQGKLHAECEALGK